jgi:hypothetical protein
MICLRRDRLTPQLVNAFLLPVAAFTVLLVSYTLISEQRQRSFDRELLTGDPTFNSPVEAVPYGIQEYDLDGTVTPGRESRYAIFGAAAGSLPAETSGTARPTRNRRPNVNSCSPGFSPRCLNRKARRSRRHAMTALGSGSEMIGTTVTTRRAGWSP